MTDIFISYAREDREAAEAIATALGNCGWDVWWDRRIAVGRSFSEAIEQALESARCVVVLWSRASVDSEWVANEAADGARRRILVPIRIEDVTPPLEFRRLQTATFLDRKRIEANPEFADCLAAIRNLAGEPSGSPLAPARPAAAADPRPDAPLAMPETVSGGARPWGRTAATIGVAVALLLLALGLARWKSDSPEDAAESTASTISAVNTALTASSPATATEVPKQSAAKRQPERATTTGRAKADRVPSKKPVLSSAAGTQPIATPKVEYRAPTAEFADAKYPINVWNMDMPVIASIRLSAEGTVVAVDFQFEWSSSFHDAVRQAIQRSRFEPAYRNGKAVESIIEVRYAFNGKQRTGFAKEYRVLSPGEAR